MSQEQAVVETEVEQALAVVPKDKTAIALGERGLAFANAAELFRMSDAFVKHGVAPKGATAGGVMAAILKGRSLGLDEVTSLSQILVVNGRVQIGGALQLALIRKHHACAEGPTYWWEGEGNTRAAFVRARRVDESEPVTHRFGMDDAARAGLTSKDTYKQWGDDMLLWRAVARMGRRQFPDILAGVYVPGEVADATPAAEPPTPSEAPPAPDDPLLEELSGPAGGLAFPEPAAVVEPPAPILEAPTAEAPAPAPREPGEDDDQVEEGQPDAAPFGSHAEADGAIAAAEGQGDLFLGPARPPYVDTGREDHEPAHRRRRRLKED